MQASVPREIRSIHLAYRPDIDGLRALAVLAVVSFHAFPNNFRGGFVGVDMFFTISGFLITSIILKSLSNGSFSFADFYIRRARRILPSLLTVLAACFVFGWFSLIDHEFKELGKHIAGGAGFVSNIVLWSESGYFDSAAETKVLLHLWSLGIEEQFYIVWPLVLWLIVRYGFNSLSATIAIALTSFFLGLSILASKPISAFYLSHARFWELLIGAALAHFLLTPQAWRGRFQEGAERWADLIIYADPAKRGSDRALGLILSCAGLVCLGISFSIIESDSAFPGWYALLPTVGTALLIAAGPRTWLSQHVLSNKILVWFGLISFPLYLWHWPLLTFPRIFLDGEPPTKYRLAAVALAILLAWITYRFIEHPLRFGQRRILASSGLIVATVLAGLVGSATFAMNGISARHVVSPNDLTVRYDKYGSGNVIDCYRDVAHQQSSHCLTSKEPNILVLGDSHAEIMYNGLANSGDPYFDRPATIGGSSCPPALGAEGREGCDIALKYGLEYAASQPSIKYVMLVAFSGFIKDADSPASQRYFEGYSRTIREAQRLGKRVILAIDNLTLKESSQLCAPVPLTLRAAFKTYPRFCSDLSFHDLEPHAEYNKFMLRLHTAFPDTILYNPEPAFCPDGKCSIFKNNKLLFVDKDHLSSYGTQLYAKDMIQQIRGMK